MACNSNNDRFFLVTVDVEDWFQVENFKPHIPFSSWDRRELRVERNVHRLLDIFDTHGVTATFFVLGWIAERLPQLVRKIHRRGHEIASHGYNHELCHRQDRAGLAADLVDSKRLLEDLTGAPVDGYRAPSFSVSELLLQCLAQAGYRYDSSYNSFGMHDRYGHVDFSKCPARGIAYRLSKSFHELPVSNLVAALPRSRIVFPWAGGGYFRLMPFTLFKTGVRTILRRQGAYLFYMHPWEIDADQPRVAEASRTSRFRHYNNLGKCRQRLEKLFNAFADCRFVSCRQYLEKDETTARPAKEAKPHSRAAANCALNGSNFA